MCMGMTLPWSCATQGFVTSEQNYCNWHLTNQFLPLILEVFGCLHKQVDVVLHNCAHIVWSLKGPKGPFLSVLVTFFRKKNSITLQRLQASSILHQAVAIGPVTSWLPPLHDTSPISIIDLLQVVDFLYGKIWLTYYKWLVFDMDRFWDLIWTNLMPCKFSFFISYPFVHFPNLRRVYLSFAGFHIVYPLMTLVF